MIQRGYMKKGMYDYCVDLENHVVVLDERTDWSIIQPGTRIVMRVILERESSTFFMVNQCPRPHCGVWNYNVFGLRSSNCQGCSGRFQVTLANRRTCRNHQRRSSDQGLMLLRNFHIQRLPGKWEPRDYSCQVVMKGGFVAPQT
ncbi:hypothetical protein CPB83DRAFT_863966 [Crepidotus variabilis]|uniref:Uncharacterized protein n=1 Tax=Crepidotus variabilis TaxID=179855 RepID=A0A9P6JJ70_9AGAR|nr:hypothetical protein CPB83DRAFT_863966 [Crepidotus variabilis]